MIRSILKIFFAFSVVLLFPFLVLGEELPASIKLAIAHIQNQNFNELTSLYSLPEHYSKSQLSKEKKSIKQKLELLSSEFGTVTKIEQNRDNIRWINLEIFGGDVDFMTSQPNFNQYVFKAKFSKLGNGFVIIREYPIPTGSNLRSVGYALPEGDENTKKLQSIGRKLLELMLPEHTSEKI